VPVTPAPNPEPVSWHHPATYSPHPYSYGPPPGLYGYPPPPPPVYGNWGYSAPPPPPLPATPQRRASPVQAGGLVSSPIPLPMKDLEMSFDEFCISYGLSGQDKAGLIKLGFKVGDKLGSVTVEDQQEAGIKPLEWQRIYAAYKKWKEDTRNRK
jgi:hypothetical protein